MHHSNSTQTGGQVLWENKVTLGGVYQYIPTVSELIFAACSLPPVIIPAAQPEKSNLFGVESSPFGSFAVGFLSTTPTCHSHRVTSTSCLFFDEGVSQAG